MSLARIRRVRVLEDAPPADGTPWVADCRSFDTPVPIAAMIRNAAPGLVAVVVTLGPHGAPAMVKAAEHAARKRGVRILWRSP